MKGPKNGVTKASFRECPLEDREIFNISHGMLLISVGQKYHEADKFSSTIELINNKFQYCTLMVCDTLQRHNILLENSDIALKEAYDLALEEGTNWLFRNKEAISSFKIPYQIKRWDNWLNHPQYSSILEAITKLYNTDLNYRNNILYSMKEYLYRRDNKGPSLKREYAERCCLNYLLEECAVMLLWAEEGYNFEIYPNKRNSAMTATFDKLIKPFYPNILKPVAIRFKRYSRKVYLYESKEINEIVYA